jgi:hypothetical protein
VAGSSGGGRHNSSGSTGSEATHAGSSPASLHNYSPTHLSSTTASSSYLTHTMMTTGFGPPAGEYTPFGSFDPHMENPPNASVLDVQRLDSFVSNATGSGCSTASTGMTDVLVRTMYYIFSLSVCLFPSFCLSFCIFVVFLSLLSLFYKTLNIG